MHLLRLRITEALSLLIFPTPNSCCRVRRAVCLPAAEVVEAMSLATAKSGATLLGTPFGRLDLARDIRPCDLSVFKVRS